MPRSPSKPIALVGFMGSGKSTVAAALARILELRAIDLDQLIEDETQMTISQIFASRGEADFRRIEARTLAGQLLQPAVLSLGGGAVVDDESWRLLRSHAVTVWLEAPVDELWARVGGASGRPLAADRARFERVYRERVARYAESDHRVDATRPPHQIAEEVARLCAD